MKIDFTKHSNEDIMEELVCAKLFAEASNLKITSPATFGFAISDEQLAYQNKVFQAYRVVLDYKTNSEDKRMEMFDVENNIGMKVQDEY